MDEDVHYEPPQVEFDEAMLGPDADPHGIYLSQILTDKKRKKDKGGKGA